MNFRDLLSPLALLAAFSGASAATVTWISSTGEQLWQQMAGLPLEPGAPEAPPQVRVDPAKTFRAIESFDNPAPLAPTTTTLSVGESFDDEAHAHSLTVIRINSRR